jgi:hypothetical protein
MIDALRDRPAVWTGRPVELICGQISEQASRLCSDSSNLRLKIFQVPNHLLDGDVWLSDIRTHMMSNLSGNQR